MDPGLDDTGELSTSRETHAANLRTQLERTRGTYLMMRESGYSKDRAVRLRFAYRRAPQSAANALAEFLRDRTKYVVKVDPDGDGFLVHGVTKRARLSASSLGRWVHWMYTTGYRLVCVFDGGGARV